MEEKRGELRLTGNGGQGIILASIILAEAALIAGKNAVQSQVYGPEARGGICKAEVIIADGDISFTKVIKPTFLLALTQESLNMYSKTISDDCLVMADSTLEIPEYVNKNNLYHAPILQTAREKVGKAFTANIVAVGAINEALKLVPQRDLEVAVIMHIPRGTEELNMRALFEGIKLNPQLTG